MTDKVGIDARHDTGPSNTSPPNRAGDKSPPQVGTTPANGTVADPFDPSNLRLSQNFVGAVQKHLTTVPVRKPTKEEFVRVRPEAEFTVDTLVLELKDSRESY